MEYLLIAVIVILVLVLLTKKKAEPNQSTSALQPTTQEETAEKETRLDLTNAYQSKWLFSMNEKNAFKKLKPITDGLGLHLFTKVRLLDLLEPQKGNPKYKTFFYKVQAKHVDFVVCTPNLVAKCIIELDDSTHDTEKRKERDSFVDEIVKSVGYQIIHIRGVNEAEIETQLKTIFAEKAG